jgi:hypothetical protein
MTDDLRFSPGKAYLLKLAAKHEAEGDPMRDDYAAVSGSVLSVIWSLPRSTWVIREMFKSQKAVRGQYIAAEPKNENVAKGLKLPPASKRGRPKKGIAQISKAIIAQTSN